MSRLPEAVETLLKAFQEPVLAYYREVCYYIRQMSKSITSVELDNIVAHEESHWSAIFAKEKLDLKDADYTSEWWRNYYSEITNYLKELLPEKAKILEAGSGSDKATLLLGNQYKRTLLDISQTALEFARFLAQKFQQNKINFVKGNIFAMKFDDQSFDLVWNIGVVEHYKSQQVEEIISEMVRVTKHSGHCIVAIPNFKSYHILKAKLLARKVFRFLPGYRLDSEIEYSSADIERAIRISAKNNGRDIDYIIHKRFGSPLPMSTPKFLFKAINPIMSKFNTGKFLNVVICRIM